MGWSWGIPDIERQSHSLNSDDQVEGQGGLEKAIKVKKRKFTWREGQSKS